MISWLVKHLPIIENAIFIDKFIASLCACDMWYAVNVIELMSDRSGDVIFWPICRYVWW